jgi:hypothetical protein
VPLDSQEREKFKTVVRKEIFNFLQEYGGTRLDEFHSQIFNYISQNPGQTENRVVKEMTDRKVCSKITTLKKIRELKEMGEIHDLLKPGESGFHKLYITKERKFQRIDKIISDIETVLDSLNKSFEKISKMHKHTKKDEQEQDHAFLGMYDFVINHIFDLLLFYIFDNITSARDQLELSKKVIKLKILLSDPDVHFDSIINKIEKENQSGKHKAVYQRYGINVDSINKLISITKKIHSLSKSGMP